MPITLAFDVYGTLIDTNGIVTQLKTLVGEQAADFSGMWRNKQLEYSFRRGLMQKYVNFPECTRQALDFTCSFYKPEMTDAQKQGLLELYTVLPAFDDVKSSLDQLQTTGFRLFAFSNGTAAAVDTLLTTAGIRDYFSGIVSADELKTFKPDPAIYQHFLKRSGSAATAAWLVSGNPFDVIGAVSAGMKAAWLRRSPGMIFDPWEIQPDIIVTSLSELASTIRQAASVKPAS